MTAQLPDPGSPDSGYESPPKEMAQKNPRLHSQSTSIHPFAAARQKRFVSVKWLAYHSLLASLVLLLLLVGVWTAVNQAGATNPFHPPATNYVSQRSNTAKGSGGAGDGGFVRWLYGGKYMPNKGDPYECDNLYGPAKCRCYRNHGMNCKGQPLSDDGLSYPPVPIPSPGEPVDSYDINPWDSNLPNRFQVHVFVGLLPGAKSIGHELAGVVSITLNSTVDKLEIHLPKRFQDMEEEKKQHKGGGNTGAWPPLEINYEMELGGGGNNGSWNGRGDDDCDRSNHGDVGSVNKDNKNCTPKTNGTGGGGGGNRSINKYNGNNRHLRSLVDVLPATEITSGKANDDSFHLYYTSRDHKLFRRGYQRWWWHYTIAYNCFWGDGQVNDPVMSGPMVGRLDADVKRILKQRHLAMEEWLVELERDPGLLLGWDESLISLETESTPAPSFSNKDQSGSNDQGSGADSGEGESPPETESAVYLQPLDPHLWGWERYLGLALFSLAFVGVAIMTQIGSMRHRRRLRKQVWANLASEEGIKDLLRTGWIIKGNRMEVFDKSKVGYNDNDSMLIGGFEQKETVLGTEVTFTNEGGDSSSVRTPRTITGHLSGEFLKHASDENLKS